MRSTIYQIVLLYLRFFARLSLFFHKPKIIGITGSVGKTSTREAIYAMLKEYAPTKMIKKGNSEIGIPLGILGLQVKTNSITDWTRLLFLAPLRLKYLKKTKYLVVEMGIDEPDPPKNMEFLLTIVKPEICIFLNVFPVHTMQFEKTIPNLLQSTKLSDEEKMNLILKRIAEEKGKLVTQNPRCTTVIYNADNEYVRDLVNMFRNSDENTRDKQFLAFGENSENSLFYKGYDITLRGTNFEFRLEQQQQSIKLQLSRFLLPQVYEETFAATILAGKAVGLSKAQIVTGILQHFELPAGRSSIFHGIKDSIIIDSSYNASKRPVLAFLELLSKLRSEEERPTVFLFGDMRELGERARQEHEEVVENIPSVVQYLYCVGPLTKKYVIPRLQKYLKEVRWFENSQDAGEYLRANLPERALVLVKGSQNTIYLEEALKFILKDKADIARLCRQDEFWRRKKEKFFQSTAWGK